ncbi:hypothetical protein F5B17DRAFT_104208 [Nemania serpens]|nr:hypothetical protein F5B17DRAFT_104208 [Nemania serpens]
MNGDDSGSYSTNLRVPTHAILIPCSSYLCQDIIPVCSHEHSLLSSLPPSPSPVTVRLTCVLLHLLRLPIRLSYCNYCPICSFSLAECWPHDVASNPMQYPRPLTYLRLPLKQCALRPQLGHGQVRVPCAVLRTNQSIWLRLPRNARGSPPLDSGLTRRHCSMLLSHVTCLRHLFLSPGFRYTGVLLVPLAESLCGFLDLPSSLICQITTIIIVAC